MAKRISGSIRKVVLDGIPFEVAADTNITEMGSAYENDGIPSSGGNMRKMTKRVETKEGIVLLVDAAEREILKELADRTTNFPMSRTNAAGDVERATGWIEYENHETEENRSTIKMFPEDKWEPFIAS
jgi:hypothetical protein